MVSDLNPSIQTLIDEGSRRMASEALIAVQPLHDFGETEQKIVRMNGAASIMEFSKKPLDRIIDVATVESFCDYLNSAHAANGGIVSVRDNTDGISGSTLGTYADLNVGNHNKHLLYLDQTVSPELALILGCRQRTSQKGFWETCRTYLRDCVKNADVLAAQLASIKVRKNTERAMNISSVGVVNREAKDTIVMVLNTPDGEAAFELGYEWTWTGRYFTCSNKTFEMRCILNVQENNGELLFSFALPDIERVTLEAKKDLAEKIREGIASSNLLVLEA